jgi:YcxB-like protein
VGVDAAGGSASHDDLIVVPVTRFLADYRDAFNWQRWHSWSWPVLVAIGTGYGIFRFYSSPFALIAYFVFWAIFLALYYTLTLSILSSRLMKAHAVNGSTSYAFSREGYEYRSAVSTSSTSWAAVKNVAETRRNYLIVYPNGSFLIIPKACVPADTVADLRALFERSLPGRVKLR